MDKTAYGFYNSKVIEDYATEPVLSLTSSPSRLFYNYNFVPNHNYWKCYKYKNSQVNKNKKEYCIEQLKVNTIIVEANYFKDNDNFICNSKIFKETPRNIFKSKIMKLIFVVCRKIK